MTEKDKELMERYIYQVVRRLPKDQRNEVSMELQELISDMMEESNSMEDVLTKLGDPAEFAKKYQDSTHYLIGPEYYDIYLWFLKIVLACTVIPILAVSLIEGINEGIAGAGTDYISAAINSVIYVLVNSISNCIISCIAAFGGITLIFAIMERQKVKLDLKKEKEWSVNKLGDNFASKRRWTPKNLAPIPHKKAIISKGDSIIGIVFGVILCVLLIFAPQFFSIIFNEEGSVVTVPIFNLEQWNSILPLFVLSILIGLADDILRLIIGCYCKIVMISSIVCGVLQIILSVIILRVLPFWNPNFKTELEAHMGGLEYGSADILITFGDDIASNLMLAFICVIIIIEIIVTSYKTLRYGVKEA